MSGEYGARIGESTDPSVGEFVIFWDFDGTLAERPGLWSGCVLEVLDERLPGHSIELEGLRTGLADSFPWHSPNRPHPELSEPEEWWELVERTLAKTLVAQGFGEVEAAELAGAVHERYLDPKRGWRLDVCAIPALRLARDHGWRNVVVSNHVPELEHLITGLGLADLVDRVFTSARAGFEKPHPESFAVALAACGDPSVVWMIGDSVTADVEGAEAVGIPAIHVQHANVDAPSSATSLLDAAAVVLASRRVDGSSWPPKPLTTERLRVRATTGADISWLTELRQDAIVRRFLGGPIERERAEGHALVLASSSNSFIVTMRDTGARLGLVRLSDERHGGLEVSYEFLPWTWRSGYATEALRALLDWVFDSIQPEAPLAVTQTANESSRRLLARLGAELENGFEEFGRPQLQYRWSAVRKADPKRLEVESPAS